MHEAHLTRTAARLELARRFDKRLDLDVADGAADLMDDDIGPRLHADALDSLNNGVRHVRDHLHGAATAYHGMEYTNGSLKNVTYK